MQTTIPLAAQPDNAAALERDRLTAGFQCALSPEEKRKKLRRRKVGAVLAGLGGRERGRVEWLVSVGGLRSPGPRERSSMTVSELIEVLKQHPQDLQVAHRMFSEYCLLDSEEVSVMDLCLERPDGWIHDKRPDKPTQRYLVFPGN